MARVKPTPLAATQPSDSYHHGSAARSSGMFYLYHAIQPCLRATKCVFSVDCCNPCWLCFLVRRCRCHHQVLLPNDASQASKTSDAATQAMLKPGSLLKPANSNLTFGPTLPTRQCSLLQSLSKPWQPCTTDCSTASERRGHQNLVRAWGCTTRADRVAETISDVPHVGRRVSCHGCVSRKIGHNPRTLRLLPTSRR